jgi:hypothetical protein
MPAPIVRKSKPSGSSFQRRASKHHKTPAARANLSAQLVVSELDDSERAFLATCQQIYRAFSGCTTPFEDLIRNLISAVQAGKCPSPDDVRKELETFDEDFSSMRRDVALFLLHYPDATRTEAPDAPENPRKGA